MLDAGAYVEGEIDNFNRKGLSAIKRAIGAFLISLVRPLATLTEAFYRTDFGERYFNWWNVIAGVGLLFYASIPGPIYRKLNAAVWRETWHEPWQLHDYLTLILGGLWLFFFLIKGIAHCQRNLQRLRSGILWHSYSYGCSNLSPFVQPVFPIVFGITLVCCHVISIGAILWYSGWISLLMRLWEAKLMRDRVLNVIDARIEQEQLADAVLKKGNGKDTSGLVTPIPAFVSTTHREKFLQGMGVRNGPPVRRQMPAAEIVPASAPQPVLATPSIRARAATVEPTAVQRNKPAGEATPADTPRPPAPKPQTPSAHPPQATQTSEAPAWGTVVPQGEFVTFKKAEPKFEEQRPLRAPPAAQQPAANNVEPSPLAKTSQDTFKKIEELMAPTNPPASNAAAPESKSGRRATKRKD